MPPIGMLQRRCALLCLLLAPAAQAIEPHSCRNGLFPAFAGQVRPAEVVAGSGERIHFRDDAIGCPEDHACQQKAFLVSGDRVLVGAESGPWSCAWYFGQAREFVGWLPADRLNLTKPGPLTPEDWAGQWAPMAGDNRILIAQDPASGLLEVEGEAYWHGGLNSLGERIIHLGAFSGQAAPEADLLQITEGEDDYACSVTLQRVADALVVTDDGHCGGMNVRFDDIYRRQP